MSTPISYNQDGSINNKIPTIALCGEAQRGKTYLATRFLENEGLPFLVNKKVDFFKDIYPIMSETTCSILRFSYLYPRCLHPQYPISVKIFSVNDIIVLLCRCYFRTEDSQSFSSQELYEMVDDVFNRYNAYPEIKDSPITYNDIIYVKERFLQAGNLLSQFVTGKNSDLFDKLAIIIHRVPQKEWVNVFSIFWHKDIRFSGFFTILITILEKINYSREAHLPVEAVMHNGISEQSILSFRCLRGILESGDSTVKVLLHQGDSSNVISSLSKAELGVICQEITFKVDEEFIYGYTYKYFFKNADLLVFPEILPSHSFYRIHDDGDVAAIFAREKVNYLFEKYCMDGIFDVLLICHDNLPSACSHLSCLINDWIEKYLGETPDQRNSTITRLNGLSPLLVISTRFNMDIVPNHNNINFHTNLDETLEYKWKNRFNKILYGEILRGDTYDWVNNWTSYGDSFKNIYLLRCGLPQMYETGEAGEYYLKMPIEFYNKVRNSFINSDIVKRFFDSPVRSWDVANTPNNDGSKYIIEYLNAIAPFLK